MSQTAWQGNPSETDRLRHEGPAPVQRNESGDVDAAAASALILGPKVHGAPARYLEGSRNRATCIW